MFPVARKNQEVKNKIMENNDSPNKQALSIKEDSDTDNKLIASSMLKMVVQNFNQNTQLVYEKPNRSKILVKNESLVEVALYLRNNYGLDHVESMSGTDFPVDKEIEINYHLGSYINQDLHPYIMNLATRVNRDDAKSNSLINIFPSVEYFERETYEMLGVYFIGHPRNELFLLPEDWADLPPLRKDFKLKGR
jgi:NADH:ubiquinone oxidoreductase subunit C